MCFSFLLVAQSFRSKMFLSIKLKKTTQQNKSYLFDGNNEPKLLLKKQNVLNAFRNFLLLPNNISIFLMQIV